MRLSSSRAGVLESLMIDGVEVIESYFGSYLPQIAVITLTTGLLCIRAETVSPTIDTVLFLCTIVIFPVPRLWNCVLAEEGQAHRGACEDLDSDFVDAMIGMTTPKSLGTSQACGHKLAEGSKELLQMTLSQLRISLGKADASATVVVPGSTITLLTAVFELYHGLYRVDHLFFIILPSIEVLRLLRDLANTFHAGYLGLSAATQIYKVSHGNIPAHITSERRTLPAGNVADIETHAVSYTYEGINAPALSDTPPRIPQERFLAVIGGSGSGKSTLIGTILGLDSPTAGRVTIGGESATSVNIPSTISPVSQSPAISPGAVERILVTTAPSTAREEIFETLTSARVYGLHDNHDSCVHHSSGARGEDLDLFVEEEGANLSGGQRQRLATVRAPARRPRVLILDESTSVLDSNTEAQALPGLHKTYPKMTFVLITRRMEVTASADEIVRPCGGEIHSSGILAEVIGIFFQPVSSQGIERR